MLTHSIISLPTWGGASAQPTDLTRIPKKTVSAEDSIYAAEGDHLFLIPADDQLDTVQDYLSNSGVGATLLKRRLEPVADAFKVCIIDAPPQRSQICLTVLGAADTLIIPAEASVKGDGSLVRTLDLLRTLQDVGATDAQVLGVLAVATSPNDALEELKAELAAIPETNRHSRSFWKRNSIKPSPATVKTTASPLRSSSKRLGFMRLPTRL
jgi:cellulose biosynthesis protein BcsQ